MLIGPDIIYQCNQCEQQIARRSYRSWNSFGAIIYSDGFMEAPMTPDISLVGKCWSCASLFWFEDLEELGEKDPMLDQSELFSEAKYAKRVSLADLEELIESKNFVSPEQEIYLRTQLWWKHNHDDDKHFDDLNLDAQKKYITNALELSAALSDENEGQLLMKAELHRNVGMFLEAQHVLKSISDEELLPISKQISDACLAKNKSVFQIEFEHGG